MGLSSPLPVSLPAECRRAAKLYSAFADPVSGLDKIIPPQVLRKAKGFAFLTVVKGGFVFSLRGGSGLVIARLPDGSWSAPSACGTGGAGFGLQVGAELAEFIIILNSRKAVQSFMAAGSVTLGGNLSIAAGPLGRNVEGSGTLSSKGKLAAMYSYSRTKGLFGGASVEGSVIVERSDANCKAYGQNVTSKQLLSGAIEVPEFAEQLIETISRRSGNAMDWVRDEEDAKSGREVGGYEFGSQYAAGGRGEGGEKMQKSGSMAGIKNALGSLGGRSRSGSESVGGRSRSGSTSGPMSSGSRRFDQDFGDDFEDERRREADKLEEDSKWGAGVGGTARSSRLTKVRSGSGGVGGIRGMADGMSWDATASNRRGSTKSTTRDSFDSLDERSSAYREAPKTRYDTTDDDDDDSLDDRRRRTTPQRFPKETSSPFADSNSTSRQTSSSSRRWDADEFSPRASTTPQRIISSPHINKGDPFDFSEVEADFSGATRRAKRQDSEPTPVQRARAASAGNGIGQAVALFDFVGAEDGDLSFKKGEVITILKQDDEEWWNGRVKLVEGIFPRNYVEVL